MHSLTKNVSIVLYVPCTGNKGYKDEKVSTLLSRNFQLSRSSPGRNHDLFFSNRSCLMSVKTEGSMEQTDPFPTFHPSLASLPVQPSKNLCIHVIEKTLLWCLACPLYSKVVTVCSFCCELFMIIRFPQWNLIRICPCNYEQMELPGKGGSVI